MANHDGFSLLWSIWRKFVWVCLVHVLSVPVKNIFGCHLKQSFHSLHIILTAPFFALQKPFIKITWRGKTLFAQENTHLFYSTKEKPYMEYVTPGESMQQQKKRVHNFHFDLFGVISALSIWFYHAVMLLFIA